jgi:hypothetical protein
MALVTHVLAEGGVLAIGLERIQRGVVEKAPVGTVTPLTTPVGALMTVLRGLRVSAVGSSAC